jgi:hypothetical protein
MRARMSGGVGRAVSDGRSYPISRVFQHPGNPEGSIVGLLANLPQSFAAALVLVLVLVLV